MQPYTLLVQFDEGFAPRVGVETVVTLATEGETTATGRLVTVQFSDLFEESDREIDALKAGVERLQGLISQFAKASEKLGVALGVDDYTDDDVRLMTYRYGLAIDALVAEAAPSGGEGG